MSSGNGRYGWGGGRDDRNGREHTRVANNERIKCVICEYYYLHNGENQAMYAIAIAIVYAMSSSVRVRVCVCVCVCTQSRCNCILLKLDSSSEELS